eukprot:GHVU01218095.1.p1 GENE.GHVU01218095.1~~GHVU01218095.1.p1  ORF type:complete len:500 (+),score=102.43 GHVU01218095.1:292-1791(+)
MNPKRRKTAPKPASTPEPQRPPARTSPQPTNKAERDRANALNDAAAVEGSARDGTSAGTPSRRDPSNRLLDDDKAQRSTAGCQADEDCSGVPEGPNEEASKTPMSSREFAEFLSNSTVAEALSYLDAACVAPLREYLRTGILPPADTERFMRVHSVVCELRGYRLASASLVQFFHRAHHEAFRLLSASCEGKSGWELLLAVAAAWERASEFMDRMITAFRHVEAPGGGEEPPFLLRRALLAFQTQVYSSTDPSKNRRAADTIRDAFLEAIDRERRGEVVSHDVMRSVVSMYKVMGGEGATLTRRPPPAAARQSTPDDLNTVAAATATATGSGRSGSGGGGEEERSIGEDRRGTDAQKTPSPLVWKSRLTGRYEADLAGPLLEATQCFYKPLTGQLVQRMGSDEYVRAIFRFLKQETDRVSAYLDPRSLTPLILAVRCLALSRAHVNALITKPDGFLHMLKEGLESPIRRLYNLLKPEAARLRLLVRPFSMHATVVLSAL